MDIRIMLHRTVWVGIASELLVNPELDIVNYKQRLFRARNEYPENYCVLCEMAQRCDECPLGLVNFMCAGGWYSRLLASSDLIERFYYALRCAYFGKYGEESWLIDGIGDVIVILGFKETHDNIAALKRLRRVLMQLPISYANFEKFERKIESECSELEERGEI